MRTKIGKGTLWIICREGMHEAAGVGGQSQGWNRGRAPVATLERLNRMQSRTDQRDLLLERGPQERADWVNVTLHM